MASVQMNVRIDPALKANGDGAFQEVGITPTEAVRRLWSFASRNRSNRQAVASLMESLRDPDVVQQEEIDHAQRRVKAEAWAESFQKPVRDCYAQLGVEFNGLSPMTPAEQESLLEGAYDEKHAEWLGLS